MTPMSLEDELVILNRKRDAAIAIADGLRVYLTADLEAAIVYAEARAPEDRHQIIAELTEDLMVASAKVEAIKTQAQQIQTVFSNAGPEIAAILQPFEPIINGLLLPLLTQLFEKQHRAAVRERDEIQEDLEKYAPVSQQGDSE